MIQTKRQCHSCKNNHHLKFMRLRSLKQRLLLRLLHHHLPLLLQHVEVLEVAQDLEQLLHPLHKLKLLQILQLNKQLLQLAHPEHHQHHLSPLLVEFLHPQDQLQEVLPLLLLEAVLEELQDLDLKLQLLMLANQNLDLKILLLMPLLPEVCLLQIN